MIRPLAEPLLPFSRGDDWQYQDFAKAGCVEVVPGDKIRDIVLTYISRGRDFAEPVGIDGYVLRVILLDDEFNSILVEGDLLVSLFSDKSNSDSRNAMLRWHIAPKDMERYWYEGNILSSYLLRLDCGGDVPAKGNYILAVRFGYMQGQKKRTLCREIPFGDN